MFLHMYEELFMNEDQKKRIKLFKLLAIFIRSRTQEQCKQYFNSLKKDKTIKEICHYLLTETRNDANY